MKIFTTSCPAVCVCVYFVNVQNIMLVKIFTHDYVQVGFNYINTVLI